MIASRVDLISYCRRKLGEPVIDLNIADVQAEDCIDDALQFYNEYNSDAMWKNFRKYQITAEDVTNQYITVPESMMWVSRILSAAGSSSMSGAFSAQYQMRLDDMYLLGSSMAITDLVMQQQYVSLVNSQLSPLSHIRFSRHTNRLMIDSNWDSELKEGTWIVLDGYETIDPEEYTDVYNDMFLKRYATALIKQQWGQNLIKFEGMQLPGGVTINGQPILDSANEEIALIREEMSLRYELPTDFYTG